MANYRKLTLEQYENIMEQEEDEVFEVIVYGQWESEGKCEHLEVVVQDKNTGDFWSVFNSREGSYFTDYEYMEDLEAVLVTPREVTKTVYEVV